MIQQVLALIVIAFFLARLFWQKQRKELGANEFIFWLFFWFLAAIAIVSLKWIDRLVASLGFSGSGIEILFYVGVVISFYLIFRLRLKLERIERNLTEIVRHLAIQEEMTDKNKQKINK